MYTESIVIEKKKTNSIAKNTKKMTTLEQKSKILIVDDSTYNLQLVNWILQEKKYDTAVANDGTEAVEKVQSYVPDLILLDIMLPDFNGFEVCRRIKLIDQFKDTPIIFFTSLTQAEDVVEGFEAGGVDYVTKPFNKDELLVRVKNHLELRNSKLKIELQAKELAQTNALKDKMFSIISHDLRSPVGSVKQVLDFIASGVIKPTDELFNETIHDLIHTTNEAYNLLENLLGWAKSQSNTLNIVPETIDLKSVANSAAGLLKLNCDNKKIKIINKIPDTTMVFADLTMTQAILRNLLSNAIKFTYESGVIEVNAVKKGSKIEISVKDSGIGIEQSKLDKIFTDKAVQSFGTNNEAGSGLGLKLCKDFVEKNGGKLWVRSRVNSGSTFSFSLPVKK